MLYLHSLLIFMDGYLVQGKLLYLVISSSEVFQMVVLINFALF
jgi:hypothetical protein